MKSILRQATELKQQVKEFNENCFDLKKGLEALDKQEDREIRDWEENEYRFAHENEKDNREARIEARFYDE